MDYSFKLYRISTGEVLHQGTFEKGKRNREQCLNVIKELCRPYGYSMFDEDLRIELLSNDPMLQKMTVEKLMKKYEYTQTKLSKRFGIPYRTIQHWTAMGAEHRECPEYIIRMMIEILEGEAH